LNWGFLLGLKKIDPQLLEETLVGSETGGQQDEVRGLGTSFFPPSEILKDDLSRLDSQGLGVGVKSRSERF
jgi:hypothetical protein